MSSSLHFPVCLSYLPLYSNINFPRALLSVSLVIFHHKFYSPLSYIYYFFCDSFICFSVLAQSTVILSSQTLHSFLFHLLAFCIYPTIHIRLFSILFILSLFDINFPSHRSVKLFFLFFFYIRPPTHWSNSPSFFFFRFLYPSTFPLLSLTLLSFPLHSFKHGHHVRSHFCCRVRG